MDKTLIDVCMANLKFYSGSMVRRALEMGDEHCSRWYGVRVRDYVKADSGRAVDCNSAVYRKARSKLERMVREGTALAYRPGPGAYVFYWPVGLAAQLTHSPS